MSSNFDKTDLIKLAAQGGNDDRNAAANDVPEGDCPNSQSKFRAIQVQNTLHRINDPRFPALPTQLVSR